MTDVNQIGFKVFLLFIFLFNFSETSYRPMPCLLSGNKTKLNALNWQWENRVQEPVQVQHSVRQAYTYFIAQKLVLLKCLFPALSLISNTTSCIQSFLAACNLSGITNLLICLPANFQSRGGDALSCQLQCCTFFPFLILPRVYSKVVHVNSYCINSIFSAWQPCIAAKAKGNVLRIFCETNTK